mmetsp:Transcript_26349/g.61846  ORF Transcript_26349/g.61846 Transcript_26349/m.61846 type:complete len:212 (-) Transcript_26349:408-1043(-)
MRRRTRAAGLRAPFWGQRRTSARSPATTSKRTSKRTTQPRAWSWPARVRLTTRSSCSSPKERSATCRRPRRAGLSCLMIRPPLSARMCVCAWMTCRWPTLPSLSRVARGSVSMPSRSWSCSSCSARGTARAGPVPTRHPSSRRPLPSLSLPTPCLPSTRATRTRACSASTLSVSRTRCRTSCGTRLRQWCVSATTSAMTKCSAPRASLRLT